LDELGSNLYREPENEFNCWGELFNMESEHATTTYERAKRRRLGILMLKA
jgi:hypothetical protein